MGKRIKNKEPGTKKPESELEAEREKKKEHPAPGTPKPAIEQLPTENSKPQTESMEVHHHPEVEKKGFKEYLLEGLMIFIAVMMGFFAESGRENITNGEHVKQLTTQLAHDLKSDTIALNQINSAETLILRKTDTL